MKHPLIYKAAMGAVYGIYAAAFLGGLVGAGRLLGPGTTLPTNMVLLYIGLMFLFADRFASAISHGAAIITGED